jgi:predicted AlkP superfamily phosphohydrolase/phosphomutase
MEPSTAKNPDRVEEFQAADLRLYEIFDEQVGRIVKIAGEDALIVLTSDHGAVPSIGPFVTKPILEKAGLISAKKDPESGKEEVDWANTKAWSSVAAQIFVNLKGRDPDGCVEPGEEYEKVCDQIIAALHDYVDEKTGLRPVVFALKNKDARILGTYGDMAGDVLYAIRPEFGGSHGVHITTGEFGVGSVRGLFIMAGPGVKKGEILKRNVWLTDIVPTICHLAELPVPRDCEGAIIYQALVEPNAKLKELEKLRQNYRRLEQATKSDQDLTHTYE